DDDSDRVERLHALAAADGRGEWHDGGGSDFLELEGEYGICIDIGEDDEPFFHEHLACLESADWVGEEVFGVGDDFYFDPVGKLHGACQSRYANGFFRGSATGRVGKDVVALPVDLVE